MKLFVLGGLSHKNESWVLDVCKSFDSEYECVPVFYDHWKNESSINFELECKKLRDLVANEKSYALFAKSAGVLVVLKTVFEYDIKPLQCFFIGTPYTYSHKIKMPLEEFAYAIPLRTTFIQNEFDPACSYEKLVQILKNKFPILNIPDAASHDYDIAILKQMMRSF